MLRAPSYVASAKRLMTPTVSTNLNANFFRSFDRFLAITTSQFPMVWRRECVLSYISAISVDPHLHFLHCHEHCHSCDRHDHRRSPAEPFQKWRICPFAHHLFVTREEHDQNDERRSENAVQNRRPEQHL